jgi:hypothetical protein
MSEPQTIIEAQVGELLKLVESHRQDSCRKILEQAQSQAATIVKQAHREARARMHAATEQERTRAKEKIASTRAHLQTRRRQRHQQADMLLLERGWEKLRETLMKRWQDVDQRRVWVQALLREGLTLLPAEAWRVEHPPGWQPAEMLDLSSATALGTQDQTPVFVEARDIAAGLRIHVDHACLDGTLDGLLAIREAIEAQLLAEFKRL